MKKALLLAFACLAIASFAQDAQPTNIYSAGVSYNNGAAPSIAGTALWAHSISGGTYAFTVADILPTGTKPFSVTTNLGVGIAQKLFSVGKVSIYSPTSAGISLNGSNTGWAWSTGALASIPVKKSWRIMPNVRVVKSSVSGGTGYQLVPGIMFGWSQ